MRGRNSQRLQSRRILVLFGEPRRNATKDRHEGGKRIGMRWRTGLDGHNGGGFAGGPAFERRHPFGVTAVVESRGEDGSAVIASDRKSVV